VIVLPGAEFERYVHLKVLNHGPMSPRPVWKRNPRPVATPYSTRASRPLPVNQPPAAREESASQRVVPSERIFYRFLGGGSAGCNERR